MNRLKNFAAWGKVVLQEIENEAINHQLNALKVIRVKVSLMLGRV